MWAIWQSSVRARPSGTSTTCWPDKYGANDVRPGLTGWAQIHGRDELEITEKAKLDGWYVEHMSFWLDVKCFFGTIRAVADHDGVVEGGTGTLHEEEKNDHK